MGRHLCLGSPATGHGPTSLHTRCQSSFIRSRTLVAHSRRTQETRGPQSSWMTPTTSPQPTLRLSRHRARFILRFSAIFSRSLASRQPSRPPSCAVSAEKLSFAKESPHDPTTFLRSCIRDRWLDHRRRRSIDAQLQSQRERSRGESCCSERA